MTGADEEYYYDMYIEYKVLNISHDDKESLLVTLATLLKQTKHLSENSYETYRLLICDG